MSKTIDARKETKKKPLLTKQEQRAAKLAKKNRPTV